MARNFLKSDPGFEISDVFSFREKSKNQWEMDLALIAADQLVSLGVEVFGGGFCTFCDVKCFYSYRRDGVTGRMGAFIWIE